MTQETRFLDWKADEEAAEAILPMVGRLYRDQGVVTMLQGIPLVQKSPIDIVRAHKRGHRPYGRDLDTTGTREALHTLIELGVGPAEIDVGKLLLEHAASGSARSIPQYVAERCADLPRRAADGRGEGRDVVLYGFGRIGRLLARLLVTKVGGGEKFRLRAIVVRKRAEDDLERRANLLRRDSVHGEIDGTVRVDTENHALIVNGERVLLLYADGPDQVDYTQHGIHDALVVDNTGKWRDREGLSRHLAAKGVSKVILTAPGKGDVPNLVFGVNEGDLSDDERVISAASCTTNAIVPVLKVMHERFGIVQGHMETIHAYTNDQNLIDNYHKKARRGRSAALNLVITETGAASAVAKALPELEGVLTGSAIRVPTPNVSLVILNLRLREPASREAVNDWLREVAYTSPLAAQIGWTYTADTVSTDLVGDTHAGTVDADATKVHGDTAVVYVWYDNEYGYSCQVLRLLEHVADVKRVVFP